MNRSSSTHYWRYAAVGALAVALAGCYPEELTDASDLDTVATFFDPAAQFSTVTRYALVDSVVQVPTTVTFSGGGFNSSVLAAVRANLNALGWEETVNPLRIAADVVVVVAVTATGDFGYASWWGYWGWWPYWNPTWSQWDWVFHPIAPVASYTYGVGTLVVTMVDVRTPIVNPLLKQVPITWTAILQGVVQDPFSVSDRALRGIDQAFIQSPYLGATPTLRASRHRK